MTNHRWTLTAAVIGWLRYNQRCPLVCWERSPFGSWMYRPDIIGVTRDRRVIEVELKQSVSDFKANRQKRGIEWREKGYAIAYPLRFYYAVPAEMVESVKPLVTDSEGLLTVRRVPTYYEFTVDVVKPAAHDKRASRLTILQVGRMIMHQTATLQRAVKELAKLSEVAQTQQIEQ